MGAIIEASQKYSRTVLSFLFLIVVVGAISYIQIPKEAEPDITVPFMYVSLGLDGISPEDSEHLLIRPVEKELSEVEGVKSMSSTAYQGGGFVLLEFDAGFDADKALDEVREQVDKAKPNLPGEAKEPSVTEVNLADEPVIVVTISGELPERTLVQTARRLQDEIEQIPNVLEAILGGDREEQIEILIEPDVLESYGLDINNVAAVVSSSNALIAAGSLINREGAFAVKVPGLFETVEDVLNMPIKADGDSVIRFSDVAQVTRTYKDPEGFARVNGLQTVSLEIKRRSGVNMLETIAQTRALVEEAQKSDLWPNGLEVSYTGDRSTDVRSLLGDLTNNVLAAVLLVLIVIIAALGLRSGLLVGLAIPGSFLLGFVVLSAIGFTINIIVLFALILASGMLVDGAVVVTEFADRRMSEGKSRKEAFTEAAKRMAWPIIASTATTLAAFAPLAFWPGLMGEFMKFLPITLLITLSASLIMALIFIPVLGVHLELVLKLILMIALPAIFVLGIAPAVGNLLAAREIAVPTPPLTGGFLVLGLIAGWLVNKLVLFFMDTSNQEIRPEPTRPSEIRGFARVYANILGGLLHVPWLVVPAALAMLIGTIMFYGQNNKGRLFFPNVEPEFASVLVRARGNLSIYEKDQLLREVENEILQMQRDTSEFSTIYARSQNSTEGGSDQPADTIGSISLDFVDHFNRRPAEEIMEEVRTRTEKLAGVAVEVVQQEAGPTGGKDIQLELFSDISEDLDRETARISNFLRTEMEGLQDIDDGLPIPGIEWELNIDRGQAAKFNVSIATIGAYVRLITNGIEITSYRPDDSDDELPMVVRLPEEYRSITQLDKIRIQTEQGPIPISNFVTRTAQPKVDQITRIDQTRVRTIKADVIDPNGNVTKLAELQAYLDENPLDSDVRYKFAGENEDQAEAQAFLMQAFGIALFIMAVILITQFNSFFSAILILSAVIMSTVGVLLGILITGQQLVVVMTGIGIVSLAGIVVNNNIVLLDTYDQIKLTARNAREAIILTGAQRLRPVLLTTITTILGLLPSVLAINIDWASRVIQISPPSAQWWIALSTAIAFGLGFATILTLFVTPCALKLFADISGLLSRPSKRKTARNAKAVPDALLTPAE